jgi:PAS domain S-box-containing protein
MIKTFNAFNSINADPKFLTQLLSNLKFSVFVVGYNYELIYANPITDVIFGRRFIEIEHGNWCKYYQIYLPDMVTLCEDEQFAIYKVLMGDEVNDIEMYIRHSNGNGCQVEISGRALFDDNGIIYGAEITVTDITKRKKIEAALRNSEETLKHAQRLSNSGHWVLDLENAQMSLSENMRHILGFGLEKAILKMSDLETMYPRHALADVRRLARDALKNQLGFECESEFVRVNGDKGWMWRKAEWVQDPDGKSIKLFGSSTDITIRKNAELSKLNAIIGEAHHQIKNNLQGIIGLLSLALTQGSEIHDHIRNAIGQVKSIAIIHGLQSQASSIKLHLSELVLEIASELQMQWKVQLNTSVSENFPDFIIADQEAMPVTLIINELLTNAIKHSTKLSNISLTLAYIPCVLQELQSKGVTDKYSANFSENYNEDNFGKAQIKVMNYFDSESNIASVLNKEATEGAGMHLIKNLLPSVGVNLEWEIENNLLITTLTLGQPIVYLN